MATAAARDSREGGGVAPVKLIELSALAPADEAPELHKQIHVELRAADSNGDGRLTGDELYGVISRLVQQKRRVKHLSLGVGVLGAALLASLGAVFAVSLAADYALKDTRVDATGNLVVNGGGLVDSVVRVGASFAVFSFFDAARLPEAQLERAKAAS